jgi:truncated hemoglobin YjbI
MEDNINARIADLKRMEQLESQKKNSDEDEIKRLREEQEAAREELVEMWEETNSKVTAGILDNALDAAEDFVDAWLEAFQETGDGLSGLEENFKDMLASILKRQAALQIVGKFTDDYSKWLKEYVNAEEGDTELTPEEAKEWATRIKETMPELSALLAAFFEGAEGLLETGSGMSELSKGIQGVTETTAQVIEAYLNSVRFYVADSNSKLGTLVSLLGGAGGAAPNPMVEQLKIIAQQTANIQSLLDSVTKGGHTAGGMGIKVFMD